jgi:hypothetical protein
VLQFEPVYVGRYEELAASAEQMLDRAADLRLRLAATLISADRNHYSLEVLLSLTDFVRHHNLMIVSLKQIEDELTRGRLAASTDGPQEAVQFLLQAHGLAREIIRDRNAMFDSLRRVWEKAHYPKGQSVNGRDFLHVMDDVKDHWGDRRPDLSYLIAPEESVGLENWTKKMADVIRAYSKANNLSVEEIEQELK